MIVRRWSDWVVAAYSDEPGNPFGGQAIYVADRRESVALKQNPCGSWENVGDRQDRSSPVPAPHLSKQDRSMA